MTYVINAGRGTITYWTRSENYWMMKGEMPIPSVAGDESLCE